MASSIQSHTILSLPPEIKNLIYTHLFPVPHGNEDYCNPILSRRLGPLNNTRGFFCWRCPGEVLLQVCRQTRSDVLPIYFGSHEVRFQLWMDHRPALEAWFAVMSDEAVACVRRFRLHTQFLSEAVDEARHPGSQVAAMPGYVKVDLDAEVDEGMVGTSETWTKHLLAEPSRLVFEIVIALPRREGKVMLTKEGLREMVDAVGWFGYRNAKERELACEQSQARAIYS